MDDLRAILERAASAVDPAPGSWERVTVRRRRLQRRRKLVAAVIALVVAAGGFATAALALHTATRPGEPPSPVHSHPVTVTVHAKGYPATCSATMASSEGTPGRSVSIAFAVRNDGNRPVFAERADPFGNGFGRLIVKNASGAVLFDTERRHVGQEGPGTSPSPPLGPGATMHVRSESVVVRWPGPLRLRGSCPVLQRSRTVGPASTIRFPELPAFRLAVVPAGPPPSPEAAMDRAVSRTAGLFDSCRPGPDGQPAEGVMKPPPVQGDQAWRVQPRPFRATCWADVRRGPGFVDVSLYFATPPTEAIPRPSMPLGLPILGPGRPAEVGRWEVVVLPRSSVTAELPRSDGKSGSGGSFDYDFTNGHWEGAGLSCGESSFIGGPVSFFPPPGENVC